MNGIQSIAAKGRYGDNHLLHVSDAEVQGLNALANQMYGRGLTTNPDTGLPEAFLFAPLLAPMLAGGLGIGGGALATGLLAAGLGTAEAAARDMDDPLQQGLMAGLTVGAGSALGSSLQGAADAGTQAALETTIDPATAEFMAADAAGLADAGISSGQASNVLGNTYGAEFSGSQLTPTDFIQQPAIPVENINPMTGQTTTAMQPTRLGGAPFKAVDPVANIQAGQPQYTGPFGGAQKAFAGAKNIATGAPGAPTGEEFMKANRGAITGLGMGLAGQGALSAKQEMREQKEAKEGEREAKRREIQDRIRQNYMNVGRQLPRGIGGQPIFTAAQGGIVGLDAGGYLETGGRVGDGMSDGIPALIDGSQPAALSDGEFVIPADVVSHLGNGSSDAGAQQLYAMMDRIRQARTGNKEQGKEINAKKHMPA